MIDVSVVMSVYNGARYLRETVESILSQDGVDFEFIIINDGSTDESPEILQELAKRDSRIKLIHQENQGITRALIRGCAVAQGKFIARQDCGDISLPERLKKQLKHLCSSPETVLLSCWARAIGPQGEYLYVNERYETAEEATRLLNSDNLNELRGITHHATAMFPRELYERVGGYRWQFYCAQDIDLWRRLTKFGKVNFVREVLYHFRITPDSISGCMKREQGKLAEIILQFSRTKEDERSLLARASRIKPANMRYFRFRLAKGNYFVGKLLSFHYPEKSRKYFLTAVRLNPFLLKAWCILIIQFFKRRLSH